MTEGKSWEGCLGPVPCTVWIPGSRSHMQAKAVKREGREKRGKLPVEVSTGVAQDG
jgi:hypothetical protein